MGSVIILLFMIVAMVRNSRGVENLYNNVVKAKLLWDLKNGRVLCKTCHRNTSTYGHFRR